MPPGFGQLYHNHQQYGHGYPAHPHHQQYAFNDYHDYLNPASAPGEPGSYLPPRYGQHDYSQPPV
tara:strand:- start:392 stop:586 length:195 start_codon:yes stop_codon:yes gene_type:complete